MEIIIGNEGNGYSDTGSNKESYYEKLRKQQQNAAAQAAKQAQYNRERYNAYAQEQYKKALQKYQEDMRKQQSLWYKMTQQPAKESLPALWKELQTTGKSLNDTLQAGVNRVDQWGNAYQQYAYNQGSSNTDYTNRYNNGYSFAPTGNQYAQSTPYYKSGEYMGKQYTYGQAMDRGDFGMLSEAQRVRLQSIIDKRNALNLTQDNTLGGTGLTPEEEALLRQENRRGFQIGGPGLIVNQPPQVLPGTSPAPTDTYPYPYPTFQQFSYPTYSGGGSSGWSYPQSNNASNWYNAMVQWNIGNRQ